MLRKLLALEAPSLTKEGPSEKCGRSQITREYLSLEEGSVDRKGNKKIRV